MCCSLSDGEITGQRYEHISLERNVQFASPVAVDVNAEEDEEEFFKEVDGFIEAGGTTDYESAFTLLRKKERQVSLLCQVSSFFSSLFTRVS